MIKAYSPLTLFWALPVAFLVGLAESDRARIEASLELVVGAMIAASLSPRVVSDGGTPAPTGCSETRGQSDVH